MAEGQQQAFAVFRRAVLEEPIEKQVAAMKRLPMVILAAGGSVTRESILPLLKEYASGGGEDEVLMAMAANLDLKVAAAACAEVLGTGDDRNCWGEILEILEMLCSVEETVVRDQAVESILHTVEFLTPAASSAALVPMLGRLSKSEWFTARVSACGLLPACLHKTDGDETTTAVLQTFPKLCEDETPMVRRAIARVLAEFAEAVVALPAGGKEALVKDILPQFKLLGVEDDAASVQHIIAENTSRVATLLSSDEFSDLLLEYVRWCAESPSWRIRSIIAPHFGQFCRVLASQAASAAGLLPLFLTLLSDPERDVRAEAVKGCVALHEGVGHAAFVEHVVPKLAQSITDESNVVRTAYADTCSDVIAALEDADKGASAGGAAITELVVQTFTLLQDDHPEVRAKVMRAIQRLTDRSSGNPDSGLLGDRFLSALQNVVRDPDWRVRASFATQLPALARALGACHSSLPPAAVESAC
jgi:serine/threonine-protein phosphatase 2A regulatory subunit A